MKSKTKKPARKLNANDRVLLAAYINAQLRGLDGKVPRRLRLDYETMRVVQLVPIDSHYRETVGILDAVKPILRQLRRAKS